MERLVPPTGTTGPFDITYVAGLKTIVMYITGKGDYALIEPHNLARYNRAVITNHSERVHRSMHTPVVKAHLFSFQTFWQSLANQFKFGPPAIFDLMNVPHDIAATAAASLRQAGVNSVRAMGASYTGAWSEPPSERNRLMPN
jgi:endoglucanase